MEPTPEPTPELSPGAARGVIVTGGAQGIGRAVVARLLARGDRVVAADADEEAGAELLALHPDAAERLWFEAVDVAEEAQVARLVARTVARCGRLDALVSNAGVGDRTPLADLSYHAWQRVLGVNLGGAFLGAKHAAPHLREAGGAIVNIASTRALQSEPDSEAYAASKGGLLALTHALAMSLAPEVRVNAVSPGWIEVRDRQKRAAREEPHLRERDHRQHPAGRVGRPEDVAAAVDYLLSDDAGFVTGHNLVVDGGMTRKMIYEP